MSISLARLRQIIFSNQEMLVIFSPEAWRKQFSTYDFAEAAYSSFIQEAEEQLTTIDGAQLILRVTEFAAALLPTAYIDGIEQLLMATKLLPVNNHKIELERELLNVKNSFLQLLAKQPANLASCYNKEIKLLLPRVLSKKLTINELLIILNFYKDFLTYEVYSTSLQNIELQLYWLAQKNPSKQVLFAEVGKQLNHYISQIKTNNDDNLLVGFKTIKADQVNEKVPKENNKKIATKFMLNTKHSCFKTAATAFFVMQHVSAVAASNNSHDCLCNS